MIITWALENLFKTRRRIDLGFKLLLRSWWAGKWERVLLGHSLNRGYFANGAEERVGVGSFSGGPIRFRKSWLFSRSFLIVQSDLGIMPLLWLGPLLGDALAGGRTATSVPVWWCPLFLSFANYNYDAHEVVPSSTINYFNN